LGFNLISRKRQGAKRLGGETSRGRTDDGAKRSVTSGSINVLE